MFSQLFFYLISFFLSLSVLAMNQDAAVSSSTTLVPLVPSYAALVAKSRYEHLLQTIKTEDDKLEKAYIRCFQIATRHLYNSFHFPKGTVTVLVHNASDGVGDYAHGITVCNEIAAAFPHVTLSLNKTLIIYHHYHYHIQNNAKPIDIQNINKLLLIVLKI
jgi:hypothetical protein